MSIRTPRVSRRPPGDRIARACATLVAAAGLLAASDARADNVFVDPIASIGLLGQPEQHYFLDLSGTVKILDRSFSDATGSGRGMSTNFSGVRTGKLTVTGSGSFPQARSLPHSLFPLINKARPATTTCLSGGC